MYQVQAVLKAGHASKLDKYKDKKRRVQWKKAVGDVLRSEAGLFEAAGKTDSGKIIWRLKAGAEAGVSL